MTQGMIVLGRIVGSYGLQGWVRLYPFGDDFDALSGMPRWWLGQVADGEVWTPYALRACKKHGLGWLVKFDGVDDRSAAQAMAGAYVAAPRAALPQTAADEYYWADLIGMEVVNAQGERLGKVSGLLSGGAHEILRVCAAEGKRERLLPFVAQVVKSVDRANRTIFVEWGADW